MWREGNGYFGHTGGQLLLSVRLAEERRWLWGLLHRDSGAPENCGAFGESHLSQRTTADVNTKPAIRQSTVLFRHLLSVDQRRTLGNQASIIRILSVIWTSHWTFNFSLGRSIYAGKVLTVHSFCSILEPADVWLVRPALFDVVLFWECPAVKKILSVQIKEKYFCIQLLAVTCLPFFRALAWCHAQALLQTYLSPSSVATIIFTVHNCLQCPHTSNSKKENAGNPPLLRKTSEIFAYSNFFLISFLLLFPPLFFPVSPLK